MKTLLTITALALAAIPAVGEQQVGIDKIVPTLEQLGAGWTSNRVVVLVDPLSSPSVVTNEGPVWLQAAQRAVGKGGREAYCFLRCSYGPRSVLVWINRYKRKEDIRPDWGTDKDTRIPPDKLPEVGEEVRFYQRHGLHNDIAFRRGSYLVEVEGVDAPMESLKQMAEVLDGNLLKAQGLPAPKRPPERALCEDTSCTSFQPIDTVVAIFICMAVSRIQHVDEMPGRPSIALVEH